MFSQFLTFQNIFQTFNLCFFFFLITRLHCEDEAKQQSEVPSAPTVATTASTPTEAQKEKPRWKSWWKKLFRSKKVWLSELEVTNNNHRPVILGFFSCFKLCLFFMPHRNPKSLLWKRMWLIHQSIQTALTPSRIKRMTKCPPPPPKQPHLQLRLLRKRRRRSLGGVDYCA